MQLNATPCGFIAKNKQTKPKTHTHTHKKKKQNQKPNKKPNNYFDLVIWWDGKVENRCGAGDLQLWIALPAVVIDTLQPNVTQILCRSMIGFGLMNCQIKRKKQQNSVSERILTKLDILSVKALWEPWIQTQELFSIIISESRLGIRAGRVMWSEN